MVAPGADLTADPATYTWTDVTRDFHFGDAGTGHTRGAEDEQSETNSESTFALKNPNRRYTTDNPMSDLWPNWALNTPVKLETNTGDGSGWKQEWIQYASEIKDGTTSAYMPVTNVTCGGLFRRMGADDPLRSPLFRTMSGVAPSDYVPLQYIPFEDGRNANRFASGIPGGAPVLPVGAVEFAADSAYVSSQPLPVFGPGSSASGTVPAYTGTGRWWTQFVFRIPERPDSSGGNVNLPIADIYLTGGRVAHYAISVNALTGASGATIRFDLFDSAGGSLTGMTGLLVADSLFPTEDEFWGRPAILTLGEVDNFPTAADYQTSIGLSVGTLDTIFQTTDVGAMGTLTGWRLTGNSASSSAGHFGVWVDPNFTAFDADNNIQALLGWAGESPVARASRLCREERYPFSAVSFVSSSRMGVQLTDSLLANLRDCEATDGGLMDDSQGVVNFRPVSSMYNQTSMLTIDAARRNRLFLPWDPVTDDQKRKNTITATRPGGSFAIVENLDDINGIPGVRPAAGRYGGDIEPNVETDDALALQASWAVWVASGLPANKKRYPAITLDFLRAPDMLGAFRNLELGDRITVINPPRQHARGDIDLILTGWSWVLAGRRKPWRLVANCQPYRPYAVGAAGDATHASAWLQTGRATALAAELAPGATSVSLTIDGALFATTADLVLNPLELIIGGEVMPVVSISGAGPQTFVVTRTLPKRHPAGALASVNNCLIACL